jgi:hypothetical protein
MTGKKGPGLTQRAGSIVRDVCDRFWLFTIAAIALAVIGFIVGAVVINGRMPEGAGELLTGAITGLLMIVQKVIEAQQQRRMSDQLHASAPAVPDAPSGKPGDPVHTHEEGRE